MYPASTAQYQPVISQNIAEFAANLESQFMGLDVLPLFDSADKTAIIPKWGIGNITKSTGNLKRNPKGGYARIEHSPGSFTYECEEYGLEELIDDSERKYLDKFLNTMSDMGKFLYHHLRKQQEKRIAAMVFNATTFAGYTAAVSTEWSNVAATIVKDVKDKKLLLKQNLGGVIGVGEICLAVSEKVFDNMGQNTEIKALRGGGNGASRKDFVMQVGAAEMAHILGVDKVVYTAAQADGSDIWDDEYALLYVRYSGNQLRSQPHIGRSVLWTDDSPTNVVSEFYRDDKIRSNIHRVRQQLDEVVFTPAAGYLLSNITA